jgi:hypothetical protein
MPKRAKIQRAKPRRIESKAAFVLLLIAEIILFVNAFIMIFLKDWLISVLSTVNGQQMVLLGKTLTFIVPTSWQLLQMGFTMMMLGLFTIYSYYRITEGNKTWVWFLLIIGIFILLVGRLDTGILMIIASLIYFGKFRKKK